ncbi:unnamed protein product [Rhizoctonia solani]|nr:unnamed protein product [Rhizoctonia solani]
MAIPYINQTDKHVVIKIMNRELPSRPKDAIPNNHAGDGLWNALCACWAFDAVDRPSARQILNAMHTVCNISESDSVQSEGFQHESSRVDVVAPRLVITEDTRIQDLVSYFKKRDLTDYTDSLTSTNIMVATPFADTALANVYKIVLPNQQNIAVKCVKHVTLHKKLKRAARELSCWLSHKHENILPVLGFAVVKDDLAMVSPWMSNGCVTEYVVVNPSCDRVALCIQLARAIAYLHDHNVVHGDIKGPNVLISESGTVKITDFALVSPEILLGDSDSTKEGDVYALGMTMIEIYTGEPPYGRSMQWSGQVMIKVINGQLRPSRPINLPLDNCGNRLWELMNHCWMGSPDDRPTSAEVYERLTEI